MLALRLEPWMASMPGDGYGAQRGTGEYADLAAQSAKEEVV